MFKLTKIITLTLILLIVGCSKGKKHSDISTPASPTTDTPMPTIPEEVQPICIEDTNYQGDFPAGDGTKDSPFLICNPSQFFKFYLNPIGHYILGANINLESFVFADSKVFASGSLNGNGHEIYNYNGTNAMFWQIGNHVEIFNLNIHHFYIEDNLCQGIVGGLALYNAGKIHDLMVSDVQIQMDCVLGQDVTGGLVGQNESAGEIYNIIMDGVSVLAPEMDFPPSGAAFGGIIGKSSGAIHDLWARNIYIEGHDIVGGIVGHLLGTLENTLIEYSEIYELSGDSTNAGPIYGIKADNVYIQDYQSAYNVTVNGIIIEGAQ